MTVYLNRPFVRAILAFVLVLTPATTRAQQNKQRFSSVGEAQQATGMLAGRPGPRDIVWIDGGRKFSFIAMNPQTRTTEIRSYDPATGRDTLLFSPRGVTFPGESRAFEYQSFQYSRDFKNLVFQANFQQLFRKSGTSDFYIYPLATRQLTLVGKGARTA